MAVCPCARVRDRPDVNRRVAVATTPRIIRGLCKFSYIWCGRRSRTGIQANEGDLLMQGGFARYWHVGCSQCYLTGNPTLYQRARFETNRLLFPLQAELVPSCSKQSANLPDISLLVSSPLFTSVRSFHPQQQWSTQVISRLGPGRKSKSGQTEVPSPEHGRESGSPNAVTRSTASEGEASTFLPRVP